MNRLNVKVPGESNDVDDLIEAASHGEALRVEKPRDTSPPLVLPVADSTRPGAANINAGQQAMAGEMLATVVRDNAGELIGLKQGTR